MTYKDSPVTVAYKPNAFFGWRLVEKGVITEQDLDDALRLQAESNRRIGAMAVDKGFLTIEQVDAVFAAQKRVDMPFGSLAVEMGLLKQRQLDDLLFVHTVHCTHLGEALLMNGALSPEQFGEELDEFFQLERQRRQELGQLFQGGGRHALFEAMILTLQRLFTRFAGEMVKVGPSRQEDAGAEFCVRVMAPLVNGKRLICDILFSRAIGEAVGRAYALRADLPLEPSLDRCLEFLRILDVYLGQGLAEVGHRPGQATIELRDDFPPASDPAAILLDLLAFAGRLQLRLQCC